MKIKSFVFIALFAMMMSAMPVYNYFVNGFSLATRPISKMTRDAYNIDGALYILGSFYNIFGLSVDSNRVFFGKDGWLFLGENFNRPISKKIDGAISNMDAISNTIKSVDEWSTLSKSIGVKGFYIIIGPDKDSIYTEELPAWYVQSENSITNELVSRCDLYVNTVKILTKEKKRTALPLYFKTDTHWNELGAYAAFEGLIDKSKHNNDTLNWPSETIEFKKFNSPTGDLARFQRSGKYLRDEEVRIVSPSVATIPVSVKSYKTGAITYRGENEMIESPSEPLLVESPKALNHAKVLWLRDSFGTAMSRMMAYTFSETLQVHHGRITPDYIKDLMLSYKPDYVIVTVVERDSLSKIFSYMPIKSNN